MTVRKCPLSRKLSALVPNPGANCITPVRGFLAKAFSGQPVVREKSESVYK
jgi:hypothetical protein